MNIPYVFVRVILNYQAPFTYVSEVHMIHNCLLYMPALIRVHTAYMRHTFGGRNAAKDDLHKSSDGSSIRTYIP
jgi:hypothetical protein